MRDPQLPPPPEYYILGKGNGEIRNKTGLLYWDSHTRKWDTVESGRGMLYPHNWYAMGRTPDTGYQEEVLKSLRGFTLETKEHGCYTDPDFSWGFFDRRCGVNAAINFEYIKNHFNKETPKPKESLPIEVML
jgi:hypothetical protein